jgi:hypothetical protein
MAAPGIGERELGHRGVLAAGSSRRKTAIRKTAMGKARSLQSTEHH